MNHAREGRRTGVFFGVLLAAVLGLLFLAPRPEERDEGADGPGAASTTRRHGDDAEGARREAQWRGGASRGEEASVVGQGTPVSRDGLPSTGDVSPEREAEAARKLDEIPNPIETIAVRSTADFNAGNNEGLVSTAGNALTRDKFTSGRVGAWATTTAFTTARQARSSVLLHQRVQGRRRK